jgi:hypothetical protein
LAGPRKPMWACSCGKEGNWASRISCYECGKAPPAATLKLARENAAKQGGGNSGKGKGHAAAKEEEEEEPRQRVKRESGEAKEEEDKVGSATVLRFLQSNPELGKLAKDLVVKLREDEEGEDVPFKRDLQQALLHKQRVEARVQQANEGLEDLLRQRQELDEEIEERNKRVEEVQGQLAAAEEEVQALTAAECKHAVPADIPGQLGVLAKLVAAFTPEQRELFGLGKVCPEDLAKAADKAKIEAEAAATAAADAAAANSGKQGGKDGANGEAEAFKVPDFDEGADMDLDFDDGDLWKRIDEVRAEAAGDNKRAAALLGEYYKSKRPRRSRG